jgi:hypothetical protein
VPGKIINIAFDENVIDFCADYIANKKHKIALIAGGKRTFLFLKKRLAKSFGKAFFPYDSFTNEEFIEKIIFENTQLTKISEISAAFILYNLVRDTYPKLLNGEKTFAQSMGWLFELLTFIEQLNLEKVSNAKLENIKNNAEIGYDVPANVNDLLKNILNIREEFCKILEKEQHTLRGLNFLKVENMDVSKIVGDYQEIIMLAPFYLAKTELEILKKIYLAGKLTVILHGNPKEYEILKDFYKFFEVQPPEINSIQKKYNLNIYSGLDDQSQGALIKNLIKDFSSEKLDKTVIVVPDAKGLQSVISEISNITDKFNVSAGFNADKTSLFSLISTIVESQISKRENSYYAKNIVKVLSNPLMKNMRFLSNSAVARIIAHKIEEYLSANSKSMLSGKNFVSFHEILDCEEIISDMSSTITQAWEYVSAEKVKKVLEEIFETFFTSLENIETLECLAKQLLKIIKKIYSLSSIGSYSLNVDALEILMVVIKDISTCQAAKAKFDTEDILNIFKNLIRNKKISLLGTPLAGLQLLGFLETRNLSFENVFIVGMTDSSIPGVKRTYALIPKEIMFSLGLKRVKKEFEIQKYHFYRLISAAKNVSFIYPDNEKEERSRFIESIVWSEQFKNKNIDAVQVKKFALPKIAVYSKTKRKYEKTEEIKKYLKNLSYSYSKIDAYLKCELNFYFKYILLLDDKTRIGEELSASNIGDFIHNFLKNTFCRNTLKETLSSQKFEEKFYSNLENSFAESVFFKSREDAFIIKEVLFYRMGNFLKSEKERNFEKVYDCEKQFFSEIHIVENIYKLDCRIDRIDKTNTNFAILDYKTKVSYDKIITGKFFELLDDANNFNVKNIKAAVASLQLPLYKFVFEKACGFQVDFLGIYDLRKAKIVEFPLLDRTYEKCIELIKYVISDINSDKPFEMSSTEQQYCKDCNYFNICR